MDDYMQAGLKESPLNIWIDCRELRYISSAGLGVFISHLPELRLRSIPLVLFSARDAVRNVFQVLGLDELIPIVPDRERAGDYCHSGASRPVRSAGTP